MYRDLNIPEVSCLYSLIKSQYLPYKIDVQIRLIQSMEIYDAPGSSLRAIERSAQALLISSRPANYNLPVARRIFILLQMLSNKDIFKIIRQLHV